jgi:hypothetical protein
MTPTGAKLIWVSPEQECILIFTISFMFSFNLWKEMAERLKKGEQDGFRSPDGVEELCLGDVPLLPLLRLRPFFTQKSPKKRGNLGKTEQTPIIVFGRSIINLKKAEKNQLKL